MSKTTAVTTMDAKAYKQNNQKAFEKALQDATHKAHNYFDTHPIGAVDDGFGEQLSEFQRHKAYAGLHSLKSSGQLNVSQIDSVQKSMDSLANSNMGYKLQGVDATLGSKFVPTYLDFNTLETLYQTVPLVGKICDTPINDALRSGFSIDSLDLEKQKIQDINNQLKNLGYIEQLRIALIWKRVFGGASLLIKTNQKNTEQVLDEKEEITGFVTLDKFTCIPQSWNTTDPFKDDYLKPQMFLCYGRKIHRSRLIIFEDKTATARTKPMFLGYGNSMLNKIYDAILVCHIVQQALMTGASKANFIVLSSDIISDISTGNPEVSAKIYEFLKQINLNAGTNKMLGLTQADKMNVLHYTYAELLAVWDRCLAYLSSATELPKSILLSEVESGLSNNTNITLNTYYNSVSSIQKDEIEPSHIKVISHLLQDKQKDFSIVFGSLYEPSVAEKITQDTALVDNLLKLYDREIVKGSQILQELDKNYISITERHVESAKKEEEQSHEEDIVALGGILAGKEAKNEA